jgi:N-acetylmuramoyl-L-alanine amidase
MSLFSPTSLPARRPPAARRASPPAALLAGLLAAAILAAPGWRPALAQDPSGQPLRFTLKTIDSEAGTRVVLEFTRKPIYEVRGEGKKIFILLRESAVEPPFKKRDYGGRVLDRVKFVDGLRMSELVFYTSDEYASFSTFEMGEPFRIVLDLRRKQGPPLAIGIPAPGTTPAPPGSRTPPPAAGAPDTPVAPPEGARPPGQAAEPAPRRAAFTIVIDPGHGGDDTGALGPSGLAEKDVALDIGRRLRSRILSEAPDARVIMTRDADKAVSLDDRTAIANHTRADLFVSIHANASRRGGARGAETYFLSYQATDDEARAVAAIENNAMRLEEGVQKDSRLEMILWDLAQSAFLKESSVLAEIIQDNLNDTLDIANRGIKQAPFRVLMGATMPAVLIEIAFISNPDEERRLRDPAFKDRLAAAIHDSIRRYQDKYLKARR